MALNTGINSLDAGAPELRLEGEQQAGGVYQQGSDVKNALAVWANMGPEDRAGFEGFLDFFRTGAWRDQIQGMRLQERNRRTASAPSIEDSRNEMSLNIFGKPLHELNEEELDILNEQGARLGNGPMTAAQGGRIGLKGGQLVQPGPGRPGYGGPHETEAAGRSYSESRSGGDGRSQALQAIAAPIAQPSVETRVSPGQSMAMVGNTSLAGMTHSEAENRMAAEQSVAVSDADLMGAVTGADLTGVESVATKRPTEMLDPHVPAFSPVVIFSIPNPV